MYFILKGYPWYLYYSSARRKKKKTVSSPQLSPKWYMTFIHLQWALFSNLMFNFQLSPSLKSLHFRQSSSVPILLKKPKASGMNFSNFLPFIYWVISNNIFSSILLSQRNNCPQFFLRQTLQTSAAQVFLEHCSTSGFFSTFSDFFSLFSLFTIYFCQNKSSS